MTLNLIQNMPSAVPADGKPVLTLIVLANFLPAAHRAIRYAAELAAPLGAQLVLLHVEQATVLEGERLNPAGGERDGDLLVAVQALADEVYVPTAVELMPDLQLSAAAELARRYAPALFVVGLADEPAEEGEVNQAVLEVLRSGEFPLLVVPQEYSGPTTLAQVMVAADGEPFTLDKPGAALELLRQAEPRLTIVNVSAVEDDQACAAALHQAKASGLADVASHVTVESIHHGYPVQGLLKAITLTGATLVVVIARRRSFLSTMFRRSVTNRLLLSCPVPLLLLPAIDA